MAYPVKSVVALSGSDVRSCVLSVLFVGIAAGLSYTFLKHAPGIVAAIMDAATCVTWLTRENPDTGEASEAASRVVRAPARASEIITQIHTMS